MDFINAFGHDTYMPPRSKELAPRELLAVNVRGLRTEMGLSQDGLGALLGCHRTHISHVELGTINITIDNIEKLSIALGVPVTRLFEAPKG